MRILPLAAAALLAICEPAIASPIQLANPTRPTAVALQDGPLQTNMATLPFLRARHEGRGGDERGRDDAATQDNESGGNRNAEAGSDNFTAALPSQRGSEDGAVAAVGAGGGGNTGLISILTMTTLTSGEARSQATGAAVAGDADGQVQEGRQGAEGGRGGRREGDEQSNDSDESGRGQQDLDGAQGEPADQPVEGPIPVPDGSGTTPPAPSQDADGNSVVVENGVTRTIAGPTGEKTATLAEGQVPGQGVQVTPAPAAPAAGIPPAVPIEQGALPIPAAGIPPTLPPAAAGIEAQPTLPTATQPPIQATPDPNVITLPNPGATPPAQGESIGFVPPSLSAAAESVAATANIAATPCTTASAFGSIGGGLAQPVNVIPAAGAPLGLAASAEPIPADLASAAQQVKATASLNQTSITAAALPPVAGQATTTVTVAQVTVTATAGGGPPSPPPPPPPAAAAAAAAPPPPPPQPPLLPPAAPAPQTIQTTLTPEAISTTPPTSLSSTTSISGASPAPEDFLPLPPVAAAANNAAPPGGPPQRPPPRPEQGRPGDVTAINPATLTATLTAGPSGGPAVESVRLGVGPGPGGPPPPPPGGPPGGPPPPPGGPPPPAGGGSPPGGGPGGAGSPQPGGGPGEETSSPPPGQRPGEQLVTAAAVSESPMPVVQGKQREPGNALTLGIEDRPE